MLTSIVWFSSFIELHCFETHDVCRDIDSEVLRRWFVGSKPQTCGQQRAWLPMRCRRLHPMVVSSCFDPMSSHGVSAWWWASGLRPRQSPRCVTSRLDPECGLLVSRRRGLDSGRLLWWLENRTSICVPWGTGTVSPAYSSQYHDTSRAHRSTW